MHAATTMNAAIPNNEYFTTIAKRQCNQGAPTPPATLILRKLPPDASRLTIGLGERLTQTHLPGVIRLHKQSADNP
jgi:hypothetical protein